MVHPHARGEYGALDRGTPLGTGSSPRAWGVCIPIRRRCPMGRFIPTRVGSIFSRVFTPPRATVHPHARGEYYAAQLLIDEQDGSSPRAWGVSIRVNVCQRNRRFIPTRVGSIAASALFRAFSSVHPHARGEYCSCALRCVSLAGSSPRAWGVWRKREERRRPWRFIPTRVGSMQYRFQQRARATVHPHARGEYESVLLRL